jgi:hypothetical protein
MLKVVRKPKDSGFAPQPNQGKLLEKIGTVPRANLDTKMQTFCQDSRLCSLAISPTSKRNKVPPGICGNSFAEKNGELSNNENEFKGLS